jgi:hypothetical protein
MSTMPPQNDEPEDIDARYRRCSAIDPARPADSVGSAVLAQAARLAAERRAFVSSPKLQRRPSYGWWGPLLGGLAAASLVGLLVTPHFFDSGSRSVKSVEHESARDAQSQATRVSAAASAAAPAPVAPQPSSPVPNMKSFVMTGQQMASPQAQAGKAADKSAPPERREVSALRAAAVVDPSVALRRSAQSGDTQGLATLLEGKVDLESRDSAGRTALLLAVLNGRDAAVSALLEHGADPNVPDAYGETPLHAALTGNRAQIAAALRQAGAR